MLDPDGSPAANRPSVLIVGEALVDVVHRVDGVVVRVPGGSPATVALSLGRLRRHPRLLTSLGDDEDGRAVLHWLTSSGVTVESTPKQHTSTATARLNSEGAATYEFDIGGELGASAPGPVHVLHLGSLGAILEPGATVISELVDQHNGNALVSYDPNIRPSVAQDRDLVKQRVLSLITRANVVKASDEDVAWLEPGVDLEDVARQWFRLGPDLVVITRGAGGSFAISGTGEVRVDAIPTNVVDTVGAGDTFMGALLDGLIGAGAWGVAAPLALASLEASELESLLKRSGRAAAITVSRAGANPPLADELDT